MNNVKVFPDLKVSFWCILDLSGWCNRKLKSRSQTEQQQPELHSEPLTFLCKQAYCMAEVIFTPVFITHSSPLPFIHSVNISTTDETWNHPKPAAARKSGVRDGCLPRLLASS